MIEQIKPGKGLLDQIRKTTITPIQEPFTQADLERYLYEAFKNEHLKSLSKGRPALTCGKDYLVQACEYLGVAEFRLFLEGCTIYTSAEGVKFIHDTFPDE
jgi:hypothetical protein